MPNKTTLNKLSNDVTVIIDRFESAITAMQITFNAGCCDEKPAQHGITHFCEHMLCKGTKRFPSSFAIDNHLSVHSGYKNAFTSDTKMGVFGQIVSENTDILIDTLCDMLKNSTFLQSKIEIERGVILDERNRAHNNRDQILEDLTQQKLFGGKYPTWNALGSVENIKKFSRRQMRAWLARRLSSTNCVVCISGGMNKSDSELLADLESKLGFLKSFDVKTKPYRAKYTHGIVKGTPESDMHQIKFDIWYPVLHSYAPKKMFESRSDSMYKAFIHRTLRQILRHENGLVYGVESGGVWGPKNSFLTGFRVVMAPEKLPTVVALMAKTLRDIYDGTIPFNEEFLKTHKGDLRYGFARWKNDPVGRCQSFRNHWLNHGVLYDIDETMQIVENMTVEDVIKNTRGYFDKPISFVTSGTDYDIDIQKIWDENFKPKKRKTREKGKI